MPCQSPVGHPYAWQAQNGAELDGQARSPGVVRPCGVDHDDVRAVGQGVHGGGQDGPLP